MSDAGWIKLWRKARSNPWLQDAIQRAVFFTLLLDAELSPRERLHSKGVAMIGRGQAVIAERALASELKIGRQQTRRAIENLKKGGLINPVTNPHFTLVTICNFDRYQTNQPTPQPTDQPTDQPRPNPHPNPTLRKREEGEVEKGLPPSPPNGAAPHPKKCRRKPSTPIPEDWRPDVDYASSQGMTAREINLQANKLVDWAKAGDQRCVDWQARWRNWCRSYMEHKDAGPNVRH